MDNDNFHREKSNMEKTTGPISEKTLLSINNRNTHIFLDIISSKSNQSSLKLQLYYKIEFEECYQIVAQIQK